MPCLVDILSVLYHGIYPLSFDTNHGNLVYVFVGTRFFFFFFGTRTCIQFGQFEVVVLAVVINPHTSCI